MEEPSTIVQEGNSFHCDIFFLSNLPPTNHYLASDDVLLITSVIVGGAFFCLILIGAAVLIYITMRKKCISFISFTYE